MDLKKTGRAKYFDALIAERDMVFYKNAPCAITAKIDLRGNTLLSVHEGYHYEKLGSALTEGADYEFDGTTLTIKPEYLLARPEEKNAILSAEFDHGQSAVLSIFVTAEGIAPEYPLFRADGQENLPIIKRMVDICREENSNMLPGGRAALRFRYDFTLTRGDSSMKMLRHRVDTPRPLGISQWLYGDGSGNRVQLRLKTRDNSSLVSQNSYILDFVGWRRLLYLFDSNFSLPALFDNMVYLTNEPGAKKAGTLRISDIDMISAGADIKAFGDLGRPSIVNEGDEPPHFYTADFQGCTKGRPCRIEVLTHQGHVPTEPVSIHILDCRTIEGEPYSADKSPLPLTGGVLETLFFTKDDYPDDLVFFLQAKDAAGRQSPVFTINAAPRDGTYPHIPTTITRGVTKDSARTMAFAWFASLDAPQNYLKIRRPEDPASSSILVPAKSSVAREWISRKMIANNRVDIYRDAAQYDVTCHNLDPQTTYLCCFGGEAGFSAEYECKTMPQNPQKLHAAIISDAQIGDVESFYPMLGVLLRESANRIPCPSVMLSTGDLVDSPGSKADYLRTINAAPEIFAGKIWIPTPGNHEWGATEITNYKSHWNLPLRGEKTTDELLYTVRIGPVTFVSLPGHGDELPELFISEVEKELAAVGELGAPWIVALMHSSPYGKSGRTFTQKYVPALERAGVDLALCGHEHIYIRSTVYRGKRAPIGQGITYICTGFAGPVHDRNARFPWQDYVYGDNREQMTVEGKQDFTMGLLSATEKKLILNFSTLSGKDIDEIILEKP